MFVVAFGVNHARTGKATYSNLAVSQLDGLMGVGAVDSDQMVGSARHYLPDHPQADDLFAWVVARDCSQRPEPHCLEVPYDCPGVPAGELMMLTFRAYLELATGAAPHEDEMLRARAVHYSPASTAP